MRLSEVFKEQFQTGRVPWNKGLTISDERIREATKKRNETIAREGTFSLEKNPRWKGGISSYSKLAIDYHGPHCMECGLENLDYHNLHVHHKDSNRLHNLLENLEVLCAKCHSHKHPRILSEETKRKIGVAQLGLKTSDKTKLKMSIARKKYLLRQKEMR